MASESSLKKRKANKSPGAPAEEERNGTLIDPVSVSSSNKKISSASDDDDTPSCYVVDASILPGGWRRWHQYVFNSKETFEEWLELELHFPYALSCLLSYGEDMQLRVFKGGKCVHQEWLVKRLQLEFKGIQIHFENTRTCTKTERNAYYENNESHTVETKEDSEGELCHVSRRHGGSCLYDIYVNIDSCRNKCLCGGKKSCTTKTFFDCGTYKCEIDCMDKKQLKKNLSYTFDWTDFPELPSRPLKELEIIEIDADCAGQVSGVYEKETLELGYRDLENGEDNESDIRECYNF
jgi:hypothetical protein